MLYFRSVFKNENFRDNTAYLNAALVNTLSVEQVVNKIKGLMLQWQALSYGQTLVLHFEIKE